MKVSARVRYGVRAMLELAKRNSTGPVPAEELAAAQCVPESYMARILQELRRAGLVRAVRGKHGGYNLSRPPEQILILDVWEGLEGKFEPVQCVCDPDCCELSDLCMARSVWEDFQDSMIGTLKRPLSELINKLA